eukprot:gene8823-772_t
MTEEIIQKLEDVRNKLPKVIKPTKKEEIKLSATWDIWKTFKDLRKKINVLKESPEQIYSNQKQEVMIETAEMYIKIVFDGEAYEELLLVKDFFENKLKENPYLDDEGVYIYCKSLFLLSKIQYKHHKEENKLPFLNSHILLETAQQRLEDVVDDKKSKHYEPSAILLLNVKILKTRLLRRQESYKEALQMLKECLELLTELYPKEYSDPDLIGTIFHNIAFCLKQLGCLEKAIEFGDYALKFPYEDLTNGEQIENLIEDIKEEIEIKRQEEEKKNQVPDEEEERWDDDDSWGIEDDDDDVPQPNAMKQLLFGYQDKEQKDPLKEEIFPQKFKFFKPKQNTQDEHSEASTFFDLKLDQKKNKNQIQTDYKTWLKSIVEKYETERDQEDSNGKAMVILSGLEYMDKFSIQWTENYYEACWRLFHGDAKSDCVQLLTDYFSQLPYAKVKDHVDQEDVKELIGIFNISLGLLRLAARLWNPAEPKKSLVDFQSMMDSMNKFYPNYEDSTHLVQCSALCHNFNQLVKNDPDNFKEKLLPNLLKIYEKNNNYSTTKETTSTNPLYLMPTSLDLSAFSLLLIHHFFCNISPFTLQPLYTGYDEDEGQEYFDQSGNELFGEVVRMKKLSEIYKLLPNSTLKASVALSLGQYHRYILRKDSEAEKMIYESVYIFDTIPSLINGIRNIVSPIGTKSLVEYGSILVQNNKYDYGAQIYWCSLQNNKLLNHEYDYKLVSTFQVLSSKHDDWKNSVYYLQLLLKKAEVEKDIAQVSFLSEQLSKEYNARGDTRNAEQYLINAINFIKVHGKSTKNQELDLQLRLADLFLNGLHLEKGIDLLVKLIDQDIKPVQKCLTYLKLADAYLRKRWFAEFDLIIDKLATFFDKIPKDYILGMEVLTLNLVAKREYTQGHNELALFWVTESLKRMEDAPPSEIARSLYLKGKIFEALSNTTSLTIFPSKLEPENLSKYQLYFQLSKYKAQSSNKLIYRRTKYEKESEVLQDCLYTYEQSLSYYKMISDDLNSSKIRLRMARSQINYLFNRICMMNFSPEKMCYLSEKSKKNDLIDRISLKSIQDLVNQGLDSSNRFSSILLSLDTYMTFAELKFLQSRIHSSFAYWTECRNTLFTLFMDEIDVMLVRGAPLPFLETLFSILKRLIRLLFNFESDIINKNLFVIDAYLSLDIELDQIRKKSYENDIARYDSDVSDSESESENFFDAFQKQNKLYESIPMFSGVKSKTEKSLPFSKSRSKMKKSKRPMSSSSFKSNTTSFSNYSNGSNGSQDINETHLLTERISERVWSCLHIMNIHYYRYSSQEISEKEFAKLNQTCIDRLYNLMTFIRKKKIGSKSPTNLTSKSFGTGSTEKTSSVSSMQKFDQQLRHLSLDSGDAVIVGAYLKSIGENTKTPTLNIKNFDIYIPQKEIPKDIMIRIVYLIHIDDTMITYVPFTGKTTFNQFGGRKYQESLSGGSTHLFSVGDRLHQQNQDVKKQIPWLSDEYLGYLSSLILQQRRETKEKCGIEHSEMITKSMSETLFLTDYKYNSEKKEKIGSLRQSKSKSFFTSIFKQSAYKSLTNTGNIIDLDKQSSPKEPLLLVCSKSVSIFPWELMFEQFSTRSLTLNHELIRSNNFKTNNRSIPNYFCFYSEDLEKFISPAEIHRKKWILTNIENNLSISDATNTSLHENMLNIPFHSPLIRYGVSPKKYKTRYPFINFVKLSLVSDNPTQIITLVDSMLGSNQYPIFLFTYSDLLDLSESILILLSYRSDITMLFIPEASTIEACELLMDMQSHYLKNQQLSKKENGTKFFHYCMSTLHKVLNIPVSIINPPVYK